MVLHISVLGKNFMVQIIILSMLLLFCDYVKWDRHIVKINTVIARGLDTIIGFESNMAQLADYHRHHDSKFYTASPVLQDCTKGHLYQ